MKLSPPLSVLQSHSSLLPPLCSLSSRFLFALTLGSILFPVSAFIFLCYSALLALDALRHSPSFVTFPHFTIISFAIAEEHLSRERCKRYLCERDKRGGGGDTREGGRVWTQQHKLCNSIIYLCTKWHKIEEVSVGSYFRWNASCNALLCVSPLIFYNKTKQKLHLFPVYISSKVWFLLRLIM